MIQSPFAYMKNNIESTFHHGEYNIKNNNINRVKKINLQFYCIKNNLSVYFDIIYVELILKL